MPLFRGSNRFESLILSHHSRFECECNKEEINDDDDDDPDRDIAQEVQLKGVPVIYSSHIKSVDSRTTTSQKCAAVPRRVRV